MNLVLAGLDGIDEIEVVAKGMLSKTGITYKQNNNLLFEVDLICQINGRINATIEISKKELESMYILLETSIKAKENDEK